MRFAMACGRAFSLIGWLSLALSAQADWRADVAQLRLGPFVLPGDVEVQYEFGWEEFPAAEARVQLKVGGGKVVGIGEGRTTGPVRPIWRYDCEVSAEVRREDFASRWFRNEEQIRTKQRRTRLDYLSNRVEIERWEREGQGEPVEKSKWFDVPGRDLLGAALLFRSQSMANGARHRAVVVPGWSPYLVTIEVEGREELRFGELNEKRPTIRLRVRISKIERDGTLTPFRKFKRATVWLSDDRWRLPLRIEAEIFVGKVYAEQTKLKTPGAR